MSCISCVIWTAGCKISALSTTSSADSRALAQEKIAKGGPAALERSVDWIAQLRWSACTARGATTTGNRCKPGADNLYNKQSMKGCSSLLHPLGVSLSSMEGSREFSGASHCRVPANIRHPPPGLGYKNLSLQGCPRKLHWGENVRALKA